MKDNWNIFVGDPRYKTDFFLRFLDPSTDGLYRRSLIPATKYSLRLLILVTALAFFYVETLSMTDVYIVLALFLVAGLGTTYQIRSRGLRLQYLAIVSLN